MRYLKFFFNVEVMLELRFMECMWCVWLRKKLLKIFNLLLFLLDVCDV